MKYYKYILVGLFLLYYVLIFSRVNEVFLNIYIYALLMVSVVYSVYEVKRMDKKTLRVRLLYSLLALIALIIFGILIRAKYLVLS